MATAGLVRRGPACDAQLPGRAPGDGGAGHERGGERVTLEERTVDDNLGRTCEVCGAMLTVREIEVSREAGQPFLCAVHATEQVPVDALEDEPAG